MSHDSWLTLACRLGKRFTTGMVLAIMLVITSDGIGGGIQPLAAYEVQAVSSGAEEEGWEEDTDGEKRALEEENTVDEENTGKNIEGENVERTKTEEDNREADVTGKGMGKWIHIRMLRPVLNTEELALPGEGQLLAGTTLLRPMTRWQEVQQGQEQMAAQQVETQTEQVSSPVITAGISSNGVRSMEGWAEETEQSPHSDSQAQSEHRFQVGSSESTGQEVQNEQTDPTKQEYQAEEVQTEPSGPVIVCSGKDYEVLKKIVEAEAGICDMKGRILVADVVINRVKSEGFPDTVTDVVYQKSQFSPVYDGRLKSCRVSSETIEAVDRALAGEDYSQGALYFMNRKLSSSRNVRWFDRNLTYLFYHDHHEFFR